MSGKLQPKDAELLAQLVQLDTARACLGEKSAGLNVIKACAEYIARGELPPEGMVRDYFVLFCKRVGNGESLPKALGSKKRHPLQNEHRDYVIANEVDTLWLFGQTQPEAFKTMARNQEEILKERMNRIKANNPGKTKLIRQNEIKFKRVKPGQIEEIFKKNKRHFSRNLHDNKIIERVHKRVIDKRESLKQAFMHVEAEVNPRCKHSDFEQLKTLYQFYYPS